MILLASAAILATPVAAADASTAMLSSQTAVAEALVNSDWPAIERGLADDVKITVYNYKGKHEQKAAGRVEGLALLRAFRPTVGTIAVKGCEFSRLKFGPSVVCYYSWDDKNIRDLLSIATLGEGGASEIFIGMYKK